MRKKFLFIILLTFTQFLFFGMELYCTELPEKAYKIEPGDILEINTWKEPDFSRENILVRNDGKITFPVIGDIHIAGVAPMEVKKIIEQRLKKYISNPIVTVIITEMQEKNYYFYILGEINNTGVYDYVKDLTILQAIAIAGGFSEWASKKEILIFRYENNKKNVIKVNYLNLIKKNDFSQNIRIKANDTIVIP